MNTRRDLYKENIKLKSLDKISKKYEFKYKLDIYIPSFCDYENRKIYGMKDIALKINSKKPIGDDLILEISNAINRSAVVNKTVTMTSYNISEHNENTTFEYTFVIQKTFTFI